MERTDELCHHSFEHRPPGTVYRIVVGHSVLGRPVLRTYARIAAQVRTQNETLLPGVEHAFQGVLSVDAAQQVAMGVATASARRPFPTLTLQ